MKENLIIREVNGFKINCYESESLTEEEHQKLIQEWLKSNLINTLNKKHTSYGIKHACEKALGFYVSNYDIKYNMARLGVESRPTESFSINYFYLISDKAFS